MRPIRWQALPADIKEVVIGPDRRAWLVAPNTGSPVELDIIKLSIQEQFHKPWPRVVGARPVLFEPSGRVWFVTVDDQTLLGYLPMDARAAAAADHESWIERHPASPRKFVGRCPDQATAQPWNLQLGSRCLFPDSGGIHCFDGKQWSYQAFNSPGDEPPAQGAAAADHPDPAAQWQRSAGVICRLQSTAVVLPRWHDRPSGAWNRRRPA